MKKSDRFYIRIDPKLKGAVQKYCAGRRTTISDIVNRFFLRLLEEDEKQKRAKREPQQI